MKIKHTLILLGVVLVLLPGVIQAQTQMQTATLAEAYKISANWVTLVTHGYGSWGGAAEASVTHCQPLPLEGRTVGFVCHVEPVGCVLVSLIKGLAPVKAYSETWNFNVLSDEGLSGILEQKMGHLIKAAETRFREWAEIQARTGQTDPMESIFEVDYMGLWDRLLAETGIFSQEMDILPLAGNYAEGGYLLQSEWHQFDPYNRHCPTPSQMGSSCPEDHCAVGCVALAGAQIMRYYSWPPYGEGGALYEEPYDWINMPDTLDANSPPEQIAAVANLCGEVGVAVETDYCSGGDTGCSSGADTSDMEEVYENHFRYHPDLWRMDRSDYAYTWDWFDAIRGQINQNMPIQYRYPGHSMVCDGWRIIVDSRQYHINLGWGDANETAWYVVDALPGSEYDEDYMLVHIVPAVALFEAVSGTIPKNPSFRYRYFNVDCFGNNATFEPGQWLQFLPGVVVTGNTGSYLSIQSTAAIGSESLLFSRGDLSKGVSLTGAELILYEGGAVTLH